MDRRMEEKKIKHIISYTCMKNIYSEGSTIFGSLVFYTLKKNKHIQHLTFDLSRHQKALTRIQATTATLKKMPASKACAEEILELLAQKTSMEEIQHSLFFQEGSLFQQEVWKHIREIPFGKRQTYGEIGQKIGRTRLARAVGQACNANPLALLIPFHRVVGIAGIGGYAGGSDIKQHLLQLESSAIRD